MNPAVWVERHGRRLASSPAVAEGERVHATWGEFASTVAAAAAGLRDTFGLATGDRVAIVMRNRPEYLEALFAIWHAGLVAVPVNARLHREEIAYILEHSGSAVVITDDRVLLLVDAPIDTASMRLEQSLADSREAPLSGALDDLHALVVYAGEHPGMQQRTLIGCEYRMPGLSLLANPDDAWRTPTP